MRVFDTGAFLEIGSFMILFLRFGDTNPGLDTYAGIQLKIIQISKSRVIKT